MLPSDAGVPVYVEVSPAEILKGIFKIEGTIRLADHILQIAYQLFDIRSKPYAEDTVALPVTALREATLKGAKLILYPRHLTILTDLPWAAADAVVLRVRRAHRKQAAALVTQVQDALGGVDEAAAHTIPFQLPSINLGITEITGLIYLDDEFLVFEVGTGVSGGYKRKRQVIKIEPRALEAIRLEQGTMRDKLIVTPKHRDLMRAMPGMYKDKDEITLTIARKYRADAEALVHETRQRQRLPHG